MGKYLKKFETQAAYTEAQSSLILPNVSYITESKNVEYNPYVILPFFCKLTLNNGNVVELEGSGELTSAMISSYKSTLVSAEIGTLCTSIGSFAFMECGKLSSCTIGDGVTTIGGYAFFSDGSLVNCIMGSSVTTIGGQAFCYCNSLSDASKASIIAVRATALSDTCDPM